MSPPGPIRVLIAEDHPVTAQGLSLFLANRTSIDIERIDHCLDGVQACDRLLAGGYDLLILDVNLPARDGLDVLAWIQTHLKRPPLILIYTNYGEEKIVKRALKLGARGFIQKSVGLDVLSAGLEIVLQGQSVVKVSLPEIGRNAPGESSEVRDTYIEKFRLTKRELEILGLISRSMSNKEIARQLYISQHTVSVHRKNIMRKLGVRNTAGLIRAAYDFSLL